MQVQLQIEEKRPEFRRNRDLYHKARNDYTQAIRKQFFCVTDVHGIEKLIPREFLCVLGIHRDILWKRLNYTK